MKFGGRKQDKKPTGQTGGAVDAIVPAAEERAVRDAMLRGSTKSALEQAKQIHKRLGSAASEALLTDAYAARIRSLLDHGLTVEAKALLQLVQERYVAFKEKFGNIGVVIAGRQGMLEELVASLNDASIAAETRAAIETAIKHQVSDLSALARCEALAPGHPLRAGAAALEKTFAAVTTGLVSDDALLLPEVSHRGPLGSWKMLVRAIAYFYRQDGSACERCLQAIDSDSIPARLVPVLRAMLAEKPDTQFPPAAASLFGQVGGNMQSLRSALLSLDAAFASRKPDRIFPGIQPAISACRAASPELVERLSQHISVRALGLPPGKVRQAMGGPSIKNTYFWRLMARQAEDSEDAPIQVACGLWEQFRRHAIAEGWFAENDPEAAALYLHIAGLLEQAPPESLKNLRGHFTAKFHGFHAYYEDQPPAIQAVEANHKSLDFYYLYPERLFERACAIDPHREAFERWLDWVKRASDWRAADRVAEHWHRALPKDSRPLLLLMDSAEKRGALNKAFAFLEEAQKLDALNSEVRRAALRLLTAQAIRHLRQRKPHLAEQELTELELLPQAQEGDRPAFLASLRWTCCIIRQDAQGAIGYFTEVSRLLQSADAALLTCESTARACGLKREEYVGSLQHKTAKGQSGSPAGSVARAGALGDDMGVAFDIPAEWESSLFKELSAKRSDLEARQLRALAEAALRRNRRQLAYAASAAGLAKGGDTEARFLLLRARALPEFEYERRMECFAAAAELGRRRRDMALVDEAVELQRGRRRGRSNFFDWIDALHQPTSMTTSELHAVLEREKRAQKFPSARRDSFSTPFEKVPFFDDEDDAFFDDEDEHLFPPEFEAVAKLLVEIGAASRKKERRTERRKKSSGGIQNQGDLF